MGKNRYILRIDDRMMLFFNNSGLFNNVKVMAVIMEHVFYLSKVLLGDVVNTDNTYNDLRITIKEETDIDDVESVLYLIEDVTSYYLNILVIHDLLSTDLVILDINDDQMLVCDNIATEHYDNINK